MVLGQDRVWQAREMGQGKREVGPRLVVRNLVTAFRRPRWVVPNLRGKLLYPVRTTDGLLSNPLILKTNNLHPPRP